MQTSQDVSWWYESDSGKAGPIDLENLSELVQTGAISPETLVWTDGMAEWRRADSLPSIAEIFVHVPPPLPPPLISPSVDRSPDDSIENQSGPNSLSAPPATPWPRFFARILDIWIEALPAGFVVGFVLYAIDAQMADKLFSNAASAGIVVLPFVMVIDGLLVGLAGNSIGKAILGVKILPNGDQRFSVGPAIKRNMEVWVKGLAIGLPIVNLFTMSAAYKKLNSGEKLNWDKDSNVRVVRIGSEPWRYVVFSVLFAALLWLNVLLTL